MGVYIKGMRMPENCCECGIRGYDANAEEEYCPFSLIECLSIGRQDSCPLVALPEKHGRLIDAEELIETAEFYETEMDIKNHSKTVIEAEGE